MMDCKSMDTPMEKHMNKLSDSTSDSYFVDPMMYRKLIESLMYLVNTVITEISSAHGYKNSASSNSDEVIHGPELISQHSKKVKKLYKVVNN
jgi:hypothetical protein